MSDDFELAVKSTIDKLMTGARTALAVDTPTLTAVEIDDLQSTDRDLGSVQPALFWQWRTLNEQVGQTLYTCEFLVGVKTVGDKGGYQLAALLAGLMGYFKAGDLISCCNYSALAGPYPEVGSLYILRRDIDPQQFDKQANLRYARVQGRVTRWPS